LQASDLKGAIAAYEKSLAINRYLSKDSSHPFSPGLSQVSLDLESIGDLQYKMGDVKGALSYYERARTAKREHDHGDAGTAILKIATIKLRTDDLVGALEMMDQLFVGLYRSNDNPLLNAVRKMFTDMKIVANTESSASNRRELSSKLKDLGNLYMMLVPDASDPNARSFLEFALGLCDQSLKLRQALAAEKGDEQAQLDLAEILAVIGDAKIKLADREGALAAYKQTLAIAREAASDESDVRAQVLLGTALASVAGFQSDPTPLLREALAIFDVLDKQGQLPPAVVQMGVIEKIKSQIEAH
jgi:tetratricopeptide (TPR) repeat protein